MRHFLADDDLSPAEQAEVLDLAAWLKDNPYAKQLLAPGKTIAVIFDKTSLRTRFSFATAAAHLGGTAITVGSAETQMGKGESIEDTAKVLSRYAEAIVWRTFAHSNLEAMAAAADVPVINSLSDDLHPCQILADLQTIKEHFDDLTSIKAVYLGDGSNNMANSYMLGFATAGLDITIIAPKDFQPEQKFVDRAINRAAQTGARVEVTDDITAAAGAHVVITDTWVSMGQEQDGKDRNTPFRPYQVDANLMDKASADAIFLHCLPAYRGNEVAAEVIDGPQSVVFDEAENRLHAQKALMVWLLEHKAKAAQ
ncbi:ornithine carbamoyltransferase [Corynebacterium phocae]|uniref:Ornithine carbamoyltransferase n=1 Tax=Corynebacterium phocae TaxID=161895 RepID=A0A1L7D339_9CORY|nr:ornithine carbamoyltransferase [Corynebacterium phocae]APT92586.1 ornithine carbamoyltransferase [Corynebacterium phocae]KAA8724141.1 ornithine carbamoyltransferase [Corynebacterium phocae]